MFIVTLFTNRKDIVWIENKSETDFVAKLNSDFALKKGEEKEVKKGMVKTHIWDWECENQYQETIRRKMMGIDHYKLEFKEKEYIVKSKKLADAHENMELAEPEFEDLDFLNEPNRCQALTAKGEPCKREALESSSFCALHKKKGDKK